MNRLGSRLPLITFLVIFIALLSFLSLSSGQIRIDSTKVLNGIFMRSTDTVNSIIWQVRMPRLMMAIVLGALTSLTGTLILGLFGSIVLQRPLVKGYYLLCLLIALFSAGVMTLGERLNDNLALVMGTLSGVTWPGVMWTLPFLIFGVLVAVYYFKDLNAILHGEYTAGTLGVDVPSVRLKLMLVVIILLTGLVYYGGFILPALALLPFFIRYASGANHKFLIPSAMLAGALVLIILDIFSRLVFPAELPLGILIMAAVSPLYVLAMYVRRSGS